MIAAFNKSQRLSIEYKIYFEGIKNGNIYEMYITFNKLKNSWYVISFLLPIGKFVMGKFMVNGCN